MSGLDPSWGEDLVASCAGDGMIRVWNTTCGECVKVYMGHKDEVFCVAQMGDGTLVSGSSDRTLRVW